MYVCIYIPVCVMFVAKITKLLILLNLIGPIQINLTLLVLWPIEQEQEVLIHT